MVKNISHLLLLPILVQKEQTNIDLNHKKADPTGSAFFMSFLD